MYVVCQVSEKTYYSGDWIFYDAITINHYACNSFTNMQQKLPNPDQLKELTSLYKITRQLASSLELSDCLGNVMTILAEERGMENGTVTVVNPLTGKLEIEKVTNATPNRCNPVRSRPSH